MMKEFLGVEATSFRNTELIYSDQIGSWVADMGFKVNTYRRSQACSWMEEP